MSTPYTLYGAELSLYTGKIRSYLRYKNIPFTEVMSTKKIYDKVIVPNTGVRFIPVIKTPEDDFIQDTAVMMDVLEDKYQDCAISPSSPKQQVVSAMFEMWADEWLLLPAMHYRWNKDNFPFIYEEFGSFLSPNMPAFIRRFLGKKIGAKFKGFVPMLGINHTTQSGIEDWYENHVLPLLDKHFESHNYLLGERACAGDFGLMGPLYAHLYRDPAPGKIMREKAPNVARWIIRMNTTPKMVGNWVAYDEIPTTLLPLIERQLVEFWPAVIKVKDKVQQWITENPNTKELPRAVGEHSFSISGRESKKGAASFTQWKLQRVIAIYSQLGNTQKLEVDKLLQAINNNEPSFLNTEIAVPIKRVNNRLSV